MLKPFKPKGIDLKWNSLAFLLGLSTLNIWQSERQLNCLISICLTLLILSLCSIWGKRQLKFISKVSQNIPKSFGLWLVSLVIGVSYSGITAKTWIHFSKYTISQPTIVEVDGYLCSIPKWLGDARARGASSADKTAKFDFCIQQLNQNKLSAASFKKLKLSYYRVDPNQAPHLTAGTHWRLKVKLKPNHARLNPHAFDYEKWLLSQGYLASGYVRSAQLLDTKPNLNSAYHRVRNSIYQSITAVTNHSETKGVILALAMGERAEIGVEDWNNIVKSGTAHLLAISGLHIGIAALWGYYFSLILLTRVLKFSRLIPAQRIAEIISLLSAIVITLISGLGYPAQRALIMLSVFLLCRWSGRHLPLGDILGLAVLCILLLHPFAVISISFWLSAYAVAIIAMGVSYKANLNGSFVKFKSWLRINWMLFIALIPISWWSFGEFAWVGIITNVLLIPLTTFVTAPMIYIGLVSLFLGEAVANWIFDWVHWVILLKLEVQQILAELNATIKLPTLSLWSSLFIFLLSWLYLLPKKIALRPLMLPIGLLAAFILIDKPTKPRFEMVVHDVGQGLAVSIHSKNRHLLYDTGYGVLSQSQVPNNATSDKTSTQYSVATTSVIPYLLRETTGKIDKLVVSHNDADHAGGVASLIEYLSINEVLLGEPHFTNKPLLQQYLSQANVNTISDCHDYPAWQWNQVSFQFINLIKQPKPLANSVKGNNASCVLFIDTGTHRILLAGDIERKMESRLLEHPLADKLSKVDLLIAPHHGSNTSSTANFVEWLSPKWVVFSAGYANQWGFPKAKVMNRYLQQGSMPLVTFETGAITFSEQPNGEFKLEKERVSHPKFWHRKP